MLSFSPVENRGVSATMQFVAHRGRDDGAVRQHLHGLGSAIHAILLARQGLFVRRLVSLQIRSAERLRFCRRHFALHDVHLFFGESRENRFGKSEILRQHIRRSVTDPVSDGKSSKFAEMAIVKAEDKVCFTGTKALKSVTMPFRKKPNVSRSEVRLFSPSVWRYHRRANISFHNISPLGGNCVPVQFTKPTWR